MRRLIILFFVGWIVSACAAQTPAANPMPTATYLPLKSGKIRFVHISNVNTQYVPALMALDDLQAQGYTIERIQLDNSTLIADTLVRGDADIGSLNPQTMWTAIAKGGNVKSFMLGLSAPVYIVTKAGVTSCRDLDGGRIGLPTASGQYPTMFDLYVKRNCPNAKFNMLVISDTASRAAALAAGQLDATQLSFEAAADLDRQMPGKFVRLVDYSKEFPNLLTSVQNFQPAWAKKNPEIFKDFIKAMLNAHRRVSANPQLLYDETGKRFSLDSASAKETADAWLKLGVWNPNGGLTTENIQYTLDFFTSINAIPPGLKVDDVADLSYLNAVLDEIGRK